MTLAHHLEVLANWSSAQHAATIPAAAQRAARLQIANMLAAAYASMRDPAIVHVLSGLPQSAGPSTSFIDGQHLSVTDAALLNSAYSMAQDFDDIVWMGHTGHSCVFAALAVAEAAHASFEQLITAIVVGNELAGRIGASCFLGPLNGQMWTFIHLVGAAAATASLLQLNAQQTAHALAIALAQPTFALQPGFFTPTSKYLAASVPTQTGIQAAYFARAGMTGARGILEDPRGFWTRFAFLPLPGMLGGLGTTWIMQTLTIKTAAACHYFQSACDAVDQIMAQHTIAIDDVATIQLATTKLGIEVSNFASQHQSAIQGDTALLSHVSAAFDAKLVLAIRLTRGNHDELVSTNWMEAHRPELTTWMKKINVIHDPALTIKLLDSARGLQSGQSALASLGPRQLLALAADYRKHYRSTLLGSGDNASALSELGKWLRAYAQLRRQPPPIASTTGGYPLYFPNRVEVLMRNGTHHQAQVDLPRGSLASPSVEQAVQEKFNREVGAIIGSDKAHYAFSIITADSTPLVATILAALKSNQSPIFAA
jgi:2-methylcitrate dehydratase PrpD